MRVRITVTAGYFSRWINALHPLEVNEQRVKFNTELMSERYRGKKISKKSHKDVTALSYRDFMRTTLTFNIAQDLHDPFP